MVVFSIVMFIFGSLSSVEIICSVELHRLHDWQYLGPPQLWPGIFSHHFHDANPEWKDPDMSKDTPSFQQAQDIATLKQMQKRLEQMSSLQEVFQDSNSKFGWLWYLWVSPKNCPYETERTSP